MSLCTGCRHGMWYERANGARQQLCFAGDTDALRVPGDIVRCSRFDAASTPAIWDMKEVAWRLERRANGQIKGFEPPKDEE